ncbi:DUF4372 domain-containing protein [Paenibacillus ferrarius]|uniref:DUF4372 domain-containing protein n=1 Tax=Paenibacillus ferrarius TaxID=1469647 RepID=UPI001FCA3A5E|nr:DUF4372 domain-containing protein [Paenibacillus ferrarius]
MAGSSCPKSTEKDQLLDKDTLFSSFGKWLEPICLKTFKDRIAKTQQDKYVKKLTTPAYLKLFLHAQLQQRDGLREIADDVLSEDFQKELGLESISAAQLCRKHNQVDSTLLEQIFVCRPRCPNFKRSKFHELPK